MQSMLQNSRKFESLLHEFLGKDYDGESPDRAAYPESGSLVGEDGAFLLLRLTGSPIFQAMKTSIASISEVADDVFAATPGKGAFDWIRSSVAWIEELHDSLVVPTSSVEGSDGLKRLVLSKDTALRIMKEGEEILFNFPDDLRQTLSQHKIFVSTNKEGKLTVKSTKGGSHHAIGVVGIRWCPFLFDSLKADLERLQAWELSMHAVSEEFICFSKETKDSPSDTPIVVRYHEFREILTDLLDEAAELVVAPSSNFLEPGRMLLSSVETRIKQSSSPSIAEAFASTKYKEGTAVVGDRLALLDALVARKVLAGDSLYSKVKNSLESREGHFRNAARYLLVNALRRGMKSLGISEGIDSSSSCSIKAWEIENALFDEFQGELGESRISPEYRDKARVLRRSIEDIDNIVLCARVLGGVIPARTLVRMPTEELANQRIKQQRATAEAKDRRVLTAGPSLSKKSPQMVAETTAGPPQLTSKLTTTPQSAKPSSKQSASETGPTAFSPKGRKLGDLVKAARHGRPPPPPPSLATMSSDRRGTLPRESALITNESGGNRFMVSIANSTRQFMAGFYVERNVETIDSSFLPERLTDKSRVEVKLFAKFIRDKLKSRKGSLGVLRMTVFSEKDRREYKKFYRDYEKRARIAMFQVNDRVQIYLVTPSFHHYLKDSVEFDKPLSTYALVLLR